MTKAESNEAFVRSFQERMGLRVDGWAGDDTFAALDALKAPQKVVHTLENPQAFFQGVKAVTGSLTQGQVDGFNALLESLKAWPVSWVAYGLATAYHETAATMQPIEEYGRGKGRPYGKPGRNNGQIPYGRGYVQLTWDDNYERADREIGAAGRLVNNYALALDPEIAADILREGMEEGWFTGKKLSDYLPGDYVNARKIINGVDAAHKIASYARGFEAALIAGGWK